MMFIEIKNLKKKYKNIEAVKDISFSVKKGSFFVFLGENGAGKSTTINILATLLKKTSGQVLIDGLKVDKDDKDIRHKLGVVFQKNMLDDFMTVKENLIHRGKLYKLSCDVIENQIEKLADQLGIRDYLDRKYGDLSGGQRRRADIARALINEPKLLILDEPTTGLDPYTRKCVWEAIKQLKQEKELTVFLTTHYMQEAAGADYIVVIDKGQIKAEGTYEMLRSQFSYDKLVLIPDVEEVMTKQLDSLGIAYNCDRERYVVHLNDSMDSLEILEQIKQYIKGFEVIRGDMDDVFLNIIAGKDGKEL